MKKGCLKLVVLIPIIIGTSVYLINKYGEDYWNKNKADAVEFVKGSIDKNFKEFVPNQYSDSLKTELIDYFNTLKDKKIKDVSGKVSEIFQSIKNIVKDSIITEIDFNKIKETLDSDGIKK